MISNLASSVITADVILECSLGRTWEVMVKRVGFEKVRGPSESCLPIVLICLDGSVSLGRSEEQDRQDNVATPERR